MPKTLLLPLCALLLFPTMASAAPAERYDSDEGARVREGEDGTRHLIIDDDEMIEGDRLVPGGVQITSRVGTDHRSLISVRGEFIPQLIALSNDI
ncbi:hypothetical protein ACNOYE_22885 [Nannocystaceae bacterium ST9]